MVREIIPPAKKLKDRSRFVLRCTVVILARTNQKAYLGFARKTPKKDFLCWRWKNTGDTMNLVPWQICQLFFPGPWRRRISVSAFSTEELRRGLISYSSQPGAFKNIVSLCPSLYWTKGFSSSYLWGFPAKCHDQNDVRVRKNQEVKLRIASWAKGWPSPFMQATLLLAIAWCCQNWLRLKKGKEVAAWTVFSGPSFTPFSQKRKRKEWKKASLSPLI